MSREKVMVATKAMGLKPSTTFEGSQVVDYSTDYEALDARPGSFRNFKKGKRSKNAQR